jgi:uncharacterized protein with HEPN domain
MGSALTSAIASSRRRSPCEGQIPWRDTAAMRDRVVHDYFGISLDIVWDVVTNHIPPLLDRLRSLPE